MSDDIARAAPIPGLNWQDASRDRKGGSRSPYRRAPSRRRLAEEETIGGEGKGSEGKGAERTGADGNRGQWGESFADRVTNAYQVGRALRRSMQGGGRVIGDETSVLGLPARLMTPRIQEAISALMAELDGLRTRIGAGEERVHELEDLSEGDGVLPVLNRWALLRELEMRLEDPEHRLVACFFYVTNFEELRRIGGLDAALSALSGVSVSLLAAGGLGALVGTPGGAALVVARTGAVGETAALSETMGSWGLGRRRALEASGHHWGGLTLPLRVAVSVAFSRPGESATAFLARLEQGTRD
ncbi:hypothetical protein [Rhodospirillum sp. A1_3_36]|uniref:hypothetical protein n=1 Tax=Rhodospirillum sp. A1_3_36 TaxID=3391666 RepID=UPI0039A42F7F